MGGCAFFTLYSILMSHSEFPVFWLVERTIGCRVTIILYYFLLLQFITANIQRKKCLKTKQKQPRWYVKVTGSVLFA